MSPRCVRLLTTSYGRSCCLLLCPSIPTTHNRSTQFAQMDEDFVWDAVEAEDGDEFSDGADDVMSDLLDPTGRGQG